MLYKQGSFYNAYNDDAIIINHLFGYKIIKNNQTGFPEVSLSKVINKLESAKISYEIVYKDRDSVVKKYGNISRYSVYLKKALEYRHISERIKLIQDKITDINDLEKLEKIIKVLENELW